MRTKLWLEALTVEVALLPVQEQKNALDELITELKQVRERLDNQESETIINQTNQ